MIHRFVVAVAVVVFLLDFDYVEGFDFGSLFVRNTTTQNRTIDFGDATELKVEANQCITVNNQRRCKLNTEHLTFDIGDAIELNVRTSGGAIKCNKKIRSTNGRWYGNCDGDADDANFITRTGINGRASVYGSIHIGDDICQISPNIDGEEEMICIPISDFVDEDLSMDVPDEDFSDRRQTSQLRFGFTPPAYNQSHSNRSLRATNQPTTRRQLYDDSGENIDVLVVWTKKSECNNAGLLSGCTLNDATESKMRGLIDLAVAETNTAFEMSGILSSLRLVHAYRDPYYVESNDIKTSLEDVTGSSDGFMDDVHLKRALYGADIVHMIVGDESNCGIAWRRSTPTKDYMFSATKYSCATGFYAFGHEIGHNFNMQHDRGTVGTCSERDTYNYGYRNPNAEFMTMLSYTCQVGQCDNMPKNGCTRIQRFSNSDPSYTYNGKPIGDAKHDNARQFNELRTLVASFSPAMDCASNNECNDGDSNTVDSCNTAKRVCVFKSKTSTQDTPTTYMESVKVTGVRSPVWTLVTLSKLYKAPIPVCTVMYDLGSTLQPAVVRVRNVGSISFEVRIQNPSNNVLTGRDVHCIVVDEGSWKLPDGRSIEAHKYNSTVTGRKGSWIGEEQTFTNTYSYAVVLGQVMTYNDSRWSAFWSRSSTGRNTFSRVMGKHVGEDERTTRDSEIIGYIVIEAGHYNPTNLATGSSIEFEAGRGPDVFTGYVGAKLSLAYQAKFASIPVVAVASQASMDGPDGSWAVVTTSSNLTRTSIGISVDEDQTSDLERNHITEVVHYAVFSAQGAIPLLKR